MNRRNLHQVVTILLAIIGAVVVITAVLPPSGDVPIITELPPTEPSISTPEPLVMAVVKDNATCYFGNNGKYTITISQFVIVGILAKNGTEDWALIRLNEVIDCWISLSSLDLNNNNLNSLHYVSFSPPMVMAPTGVPPTDSAIIPSLTLPPSDLTITPPPPLLIRWKILSYDCANGKATGATISLDVTGGVPDYSYYPKLPIYAKPDQFLSISVYSGTSNGQPNGRITFTVPSATDKSEFECEQPDDGNVPLDIVATEAKQQFDNAIKSNIAFSHPQTMKLGNTVKLKLLLSPLVSETQLVATLVVDPGLTPISTGVFLNPGGDTFVVESATNVESTNRMKAELKSQRPGAFIIERLHSDDIQVSTNAIWEWSVTAKEKGVHYLTLNIYMLYKVDGQEIWTQVESYEESIEVTVKPLDQIGLFDWKWVVGILLPALFIPLFFRWYDKKKRKPVSQKTTTKGKRKTKTDKED